MNAMALAPISSNVVGTSPELLDTPALSNRITSPILGQAVDHSRSMVHGAGEVLVENQRHID